MINALFLDVPEFAPFREQTSLVGALPGRVELLPLFAKTDDEHVPERAGLRDPLSEPDVEPEDLRLAQEAECLATKIGEMAGVWQIEEKGGTGEPDNDRCATATSCCWCAREPIWSVTNGR